MDLTLTDVQKQLRDSAQRYLGAEYSFERMRRAADRLDGFDPAFWRQAADMGWLGALLPEAAGGYGESPGDALVLLECAGCALVVEPLLAGVLVPAQALLAAAPERAPELLTPVTEGKRIFALAWAEAGQRYDLTPAATRATASGGGWKLSGRKLAVLAAPQADIIVVSAASEQGMGLFLVPREAPGLTLAPHQMIDGHGAADLVFDDVQLGADALLGTPETALTALETALDWGAAGASAAAVGAMDAVMTQTLEYAQTRKQFGKAIGEFQVVQHRLAAMSVQLEYAKAMLPLLSDRLDAAPRTRRLAVSAARAKIGPAAKHVASEGVQLHGGIGMTDELAISHYFRKIQTLEFAYGDSRHHLERYRAGRGADYDIVAA